MRAAQQGHRDAYEQLLHELGDVIERFLRRRLGDAPYLEDHVQECLLALHNARHTYDPRRPFRPWMFTIVRHRSIDLLRRAPPSHVPLPPGLHEEPDRIDDRMDAARALDRLEPREREALQLTKMAGYSMAEAGSRCGISEGAMKVRVHRALKRVRQLVTTGPDAP